MFSRRAIRVTASRASLYYVRSKTTKSKPLITSYPVSLKFQYPSSDIPYILTFTSKKDIENFLSERKQFLSNPITGHSIRPSQTEMIDPTMTYDIVGPGYPYPYREKSLSREQVWDRVFERKTAEALKKWLVLEGEEFVEMPRVIKDSARQDVSNWELMVELSDGTVIFLESKFRMSKVSCQLIF
jgi:hypothetical protein